MRGWQWSRHRTNECWETSTARAACSECNAWWSAHLLCGRMPFPAAGWRGGLACLWGGGVSVVPGSPASASLSHFACNRWERGSGHPRSLRVRRWLRLTTQQRSGGWFRLRLLCGALQRCRRGMQLRLHSLLGGTAAPRNGSATVRHKMAMGPLRGVWVGWIGHPACCCVQGQGAVEPRLWTAAQLVECGMLCQRRPTMGLL